ncbi:MAG: hypothetical protein AABX52_04805 [Nanoarchaeota archaeon]
MLKQDVEKTLTFIKLHSPKRKFVQSIDMIVALRNLDLKKPEDQIDVYLALPHAKGKPVQVCALVGPEMKDNASSACDFTVLSDEFPRYGGDKKSIKKLAGKYAYFIAQAALMPQIAKIFGRVFGPKQRMPNPKAGCVVPSNTNLKPIVDKLKKTVRLSAKTSPVIQVSVGMEDQDEAQVVDNAVAVYNAIAHAVRDEKENVKEVMLKLTMSPAYTVGKELVVKKKEDTTKKQETIAGIGANEIKTQQSQESKAKKSDKSVDKIEPKIVKSSKKKSKQVEK